MTDTCKPPSGERQDNLTDKFLMDESNPATEHPFLWIDSQQLLESSLAELSGGLVAVDTEFVRTNTFYPKPGLIQLCTAERALLIDPQQIQDWQPLNRLFGDAGMIKVVHACGEDLDLFCSLDITLPTPLFDTQIAAAILGGGLNEGLQRLTARLLDLHLTKHETRSDWTKRPLSEDQIRYAREDVVILLSLWQKLSQMLEAQGKASLVLAEGTEMVRQASNPVSDEKAYLKLRGGWKLEPDAQRLLSQLAAWRERTARLSDRPRKFICTDDDLLQIARCRPVTTAQLTHHAEIKGAALRRYGKEIVSVVHKQVVQKQVVQKQEVSLPDSDDFTLIRPPLPKDAKGLYQKLKSKAYDIAEAKGIQPALIASRTMLENLMYWYLNGRKGVNPQLMTGWRLQWIGKELINFIEQEF